MRSDSADGWRMPLLRWTPRAVEGRRGPCLAITRPSASQQGSALPSRSVDGRGDVAMMRCAGDAAWLAAFMVVMSRARGVQAWMGHGDVQTPVKYMHDRSRAGARLLSAALRPSLG